MECAPHVSSGIDPLRGHRDDAGPSSAQRGALEIRPTAGSLGRRAALHGVQDRPKDENWGTRIHEMSIAMFLHARNPPAPPSLPLSRHPSLRDPPLQLSALSPSTGRRRNPHNPDAHGPLSRQITEHLRDVMDVIAEDFGCR